METEMTQAPRGLWGDLVVQGKGRGGEGRERVGPQAKLSEAKTTEGEAEKGGGEDRARLGMSQR
jgi:hypothetical protein